MTNNEYAEPIGRHTELNPKLWEGDRLKSSVRGALLRIAEDFLDFVDVPVEVLDIVLAGGNANVNYSEHSDIDLHIIADYDQVSCDREVAELFDTKRLLYKRDYDISVFGIPVELYIEDSRTPAVSASYSILKEQWIEKPSGHVPEFDEAEVKRMVDIWHKVIKGAILSADISTARQTMSLLRSYRKKGLKSEDGEFSVANLVYKSLRNDHTVEGLMTLINHLHDQSLSLGL
jgi:hypothetical protein